MEAYRVSNGTIILTALNKAKFDTDFVSIHSFTLCHNEEVKG